MPIFIGGSINCVCGIAFDAALTAASNLFANSVPLLPIVPMTAVPALTVLVAVVIPAATILVPA